MSWLSSFIGKKIGQKIGEKINQNREATTADNLNPNNISKQQQLLNSGKTITLNSPQSSRFTFNDRLAKDSKNVKEFTPVTDKEKDTLSPEGYFRQGDIDKVRKTLIDRAINKRREELKSQGKKLTKGREEEIKERMEDQRLYEAQVPSTAIRKVKYNPKTQELFVTFNGSSKQYWYPKVPESEVQKLMEAQSKGEYFLRHIHDQYTVNPGHRRNTGFNYRKQRKLYKKGA